MRYILQHDNGHHSVEFSEAIIMRIILDFKPEWKTDGSNRRYFHPPLVSITDNNHNFKVYLDASDRIIEMPD